jgi:hypothetical protein
VDGVAEVLEAVQQVHGAVLDPVLVAGEQASGHPAVVGVLAGVIEQAGAGVQPLDDPLGDRAVVAQPVRPAQHQDVGRQDSLVDGGHSSDGQPCSVMSGHTPVAMSWSTARSSSTATPWRSMIERLRSIRPWVWLRQDRPPGQPVEQARLLGVALRGKDVAQVQAHVTTRDLELLSELIQAGRLRPQIDRRYRFADISAHTGVSDDRSHRPRPS